MAVVTGIVAHRLYEESGLAPVIEPHLLSAILGKLALIAPAVWHYTGRRKGKDIGRQIEYRMIALLGLLWIFFVGGTGGQLVYELGLGMRGVGPLLP